MGVYSDLLESMTPKTGRLIKEDGTTDNLADHFAIDGSGNLAVRAFATI